MKRSILLTTSSISAAIAAALATIALVLVASGSNPAIAASTLNSGNFETGDLSGWTVDTTKSGGEARAVTSYCPSIHVYVYGTCTEQSGFFDEVFPKEGSYFALLQPSLSAAIVTPPVVYEDAIISQSLKASNGDKVSGWALFLAEDWSAGSECYGCSYSQVTGQVVITSDSGTTVATPFEQSYSRYTLGGNSGWVYWEHTFTDLTGEGSFQIEARVHNNYMVHSVIGLDDVKTTTGVPDTTDPDTTIGSTKPADPTNNTSASFSFSSSESSSTFQCKLDNGTYGSCSSTKQYTGLAQGSHTFSVKAIDQAGNEDETPASYTWTVDTTAPKASTLNATSVTSTGVPLRKTDFKATFSEKMDPKTLSTSTFKLFKCSSTTSTTCTTQITDAPVTPSADGLSATLNPFGSKSTLLQANTRYKVVVTTSAKDMAGNALDQNASTTGNQQKDGYFTTGSS